MPSFRTGLVFDIAGFWRRSPRSDCCHLHKRRTPATSRMAAMTPGHIGEIQVVALRARPQAVASRFGLFHI